MARVKPIIDDAQAMRQADAATLAHALTHARAQLLACFDAYRAALQHDALRVPISDELNLPLWELGHIGWFEEYWLARNPARLNGAAADPDVARAAAVLNGADALYDSSRVAHTRRWQLALPDAARTLRYLEQLRERTLALLDRSPAGDDALYFFRLVLFHEDMHREAWAYMAQNLGFALPGIDAPAAPHAAGELELPAVRWRLGHEGGGFAFDNERGAHDVELGAFRIDRAPVTWQRYLPFVEDGGYADQRWWSAAGWAWAQAHQTPRYLQRVGGQWRRRQFGREVDVDAEQPAMNLCFHEAEAWCRWAGRRLPSEAEWEHAALLAADSGEAFEWGQVWEWTASAFAPYPGFGAHPYRDYSMPWFDGRPVLRGGSFASAARMKHPRYRNYFSAARNDIFAGFRSCAS